MKKMRNLFIVIATFGILAGIATSCKEDIKVSSIMLDQVNTVVSIGATTTLNVVFTPVDATNKGITSVSYTHLTLPTTERV